MELLPIEEPLAREFHAQMCRIWRWAVRTRRVTDADRFI